MGISPLPVLSFDFNDEMSASNGSLLGMLLQAQANRRLKVKKQRMSVKQHLRCRRRPRSILMKRRARLEGSRRALNPFQWKVKTLKKLIPNKETMGLDALFRETAEYIICLQMRVEVMQIMVKVLTGSNE